MSVGQADWVEKAWGRTREVVDTPYYSLHELVIVAGTYCSLHYHSNRANKFRVTSGLVDIIEMFGPVVRKTRLGPDNTYIVASLVPHLFAVVKDGTMFEEYFPDRGGVVDRADIVRLVEGGKCDSIDSLPYSILNQFVEFNACFKTK